LYIYSRGKVLPRFIERKGKDCFILKPRILFITDSITFNSGFANVIRKLLYYFHEQGYEVAQQAWAYTGFPPVQAPFPVYPIRYPNGNYFGSDVFPDVCKMFKPDIIFSLGDCYAVDWLVNNKAIGDAKWIAYVPIDSHPIPSVHQNGMEFGWQTVLEAPDKVVFMSKYGETKAREVCNFKNEPVTIYHGYDKAEFYPVDKLHIKCKNGLDHIETIFSTVCTNSERKQNPRGLEAFALFSEEVGPAKTTMYMHTPVRDSKEGYFLDQVVKTLNVRNVIFGKGVINGKGSPLSGVRTAYNIADAHLLPSSCEGFGLPILESAACNTPTIGVDYSSIPELVKGHGYLIKPSDYIYSRPYCMKRPLISVEGIVEAMLEIHNNKEKNIELGRKAREFAENYTWEKILPEFKTLIHEVSELSVND